MGSCSPCFPTVVVVLLAAEIRSARALVTQCRLEQWAAACGGCEGIFIFGHKRVLELTTSAEALCDAIFVFEGTLLGTNLGRPPFLGSL